MSANYIRAYQLGALGGIVCTEQNLQGGKTCAASPHKTTRPCDHLLQLRAEKMNGRERRTSMQSSGNDTSPRRLGGVRKGHVQVWTQNYTHPYRLPACVIYGKTTFLIISGFDILFPSSPLRITNSNRHNRSEGSPKRPHTDGLLGLQMNRKLRGKKRSYTSSGVYPNFHKGKSGWVFSLGRPIFQFRATHVSS